MDRCDTCAFVYDDLALDDVPDTMRARAGIYTWPERAPRTLAWVARHTVHELLHHRNDIEAGLVHLERGDT